MRVFFSSRMLPYLDIPKEFQVRRESLKLLGYDTLDDVMTRDAELWTYLTRKWFRLYSEINEADLKLAIVHPFWVSVQEGWGGRKSLQR